MGPDPSDASTGELLTGSAFDASHEFETDPRLTQVALRDSMARAHEGFMREARSQPVELSVGVVAAVHRAIFSEAFPKHAGRFRSVDVLSRRGEVARWQNVPVLVGQVVTGFGDAVDLATLRTGNPGSAGTTVHCANLLAVRLHHIHPFIDGNTRACWTLRNIVLVSGGLPPLTELRDELRHDQAWWAAQPHDCDLLDDAVIEELVHLIESAD